MTWQICLRFQVVIIASEMKSNTLTKTNFFPREHSNLYAKPVFSPVDPSRLRVQIPVRCNVRVSCFDGVPTNSEPPRKITDTIFLIKKKLRCVDRRSAKKTDVISFSPLVHAPWIIFNEMLSHTGACCSASCFSHIPNAVDLVHWRDDDDDDDDTSARGIKFYAHSINQQNLYQIRTGYYRDRLGKKWIGNWCGASLCCCVGFIWIENNKSLG